MYRMAAEPSTIGTTIKTARERKHLTQFQLAALVGVDRKTVDNWENGRTRPRNRIGALEEILGIALRALTPDPPDISPELRRMIRGLTPAERAWALTELTKAGNHSRPGG